MSRVGWLGLGAMGLPMARRLIGHTPQLAVYDPVSAQARSLVEAGASAAASPAEAAAYADWIFVMVATAEQAEESLFGAEGAARKLRPESTVILMSTVGPSAVRELAERLEAHGVLMLDAPVSGGVARAERGDLVMMASGPRTPFDAVSPLLDRVASKVVNVGERIGDGQSFKLVNQLLAGVHIAAAAEALGLAAALGLDPRSAWDVVRDGAAGSFMLGDRGRRMLDAEFEPVRSALDIFVKDMGLVLAAAKSHKFATPLAAAAEQLYLMGSAAGLGRRDDSSLVTIYEKWAGRTMSEKDADA